MRSSLVAITAALFLLFTPSTARADDTPASGHYKDGAHLNLVVSDRTRAPRKWTRRSSPNWWRVADAAALWDRSEAVTITYTRLPCAQVQNPRCLPVVNRWDSGLGFFGAYWFWPDERPGFIVGYDSYRATSQHRLEVMCHEIGHALGFPHHAHPNGCLGPYAAGTEWTGPSQYEFDTLSRWYSSN